MIDKAGARRADRTPGTDHPCGAGPWLPSSRSDCRRHPDSGDQASASARHGVADSLPGRRKGTRKRVSPPFVRRDARELVHRGGAPQAAIMSTTWWSFPMFSVFIGILASILLKPTQKCAGKLLARESDTLSSLLHHRWIAERRAFSPPPLERPSGNAANSSTNTRTANRSYRRHRPPDTTRRPRVAFQPSLRRQLSAVWACAPT